MISNGYKFLFIALHNNNKICATLCLIPILCIYLENNKEKIMLENIKHIRPENLIGKWKHILRNSNQMSQVACCFFHSLLSLELA